MNDDDTDNGILRDLSPRDNHGELTDNPITGAEGVVAESYRFTGDNGRGIEISSNVSDTLPGKTTITAWVKFDSDYESRNCIFYARGDSTELSSGAGADNTNSRSNFNVQHRESDVLRVFAPRREGEDLPSTGTQLTFGIEFDEFIFLSIMWDENGGYLAAFINGQKVAEDDEADLLDFSDFQDTTNSQFVIGRSGDQEHKGLVENVRLYNRMLSQDEIQKLYNIRSKRVSA